MIKKMRPTKYNSDFKDKVVDLMKEGYSIAEVCLELDVCKQTFYNWCDEHPEFLDSKKRGVDFSEGWWMKQGRVNLQNKEFSYTGFYMNMKNRFKWSDSQKVEHSGETSMIVWNEVKTYHAKENDLES